MKKITYGKIAKLAHHAIDEYRKMIGQKTYGEWEVLPSEYREKLCRWVRMIISNPGMTADAAHEIWRASYYESGWQYGQTLDQKRKIHPCLVPFENLNEFEKVKDILFLSVVNSLKKLVKTDENTVVFNNGSFHHVTIIN